MPLVLRRIPCVLPTLIAPAKYTILARARLVIMEMFGVKMIAAAGIISLQRALTAILAPLIAVRLVQEFANMNQAAPALL